MDKINTQITSIEALGAKGPLFKDGQQDVIDALIRKVNELIDGGGSGSGLFSWNSGYAELEFPLVNDTNAVETFPGVFSIITDEFLAGESSNIYVTSLLFPDLVSIYANTISIEPDLPVTTLISEMFPKLKDTYAEELTIEESPDTIVSLPALETVNGVDEIEFFIGGLPNATTISFPSLTTVKCPEGQMQISDCPLLTTISTPNFVNAIVIEELEVELTNLPSLTSLAWAEYIANNLNVIAPATLGVSFYTLDAVQNAAWQSFIASIPLAKFQNLELRFNNILLLQSVNLGAATDISYLQVYNCPIITSVSMASVVSSVNGFYIVSNPLLTSIVVSASLNTIYFDASTNALDLASVDSILASLDAGGAVGGYCDLSGGTNVSPTAGAGNMNKILLEGKGWTVLVN